MMNVGIIELVILLGGIVMVLGTVIGLGVLVYFLVKKSKQGQQPPNPPAK